ncbi:MAG TPA: (deoxy)nucleoside triphosphate pyrophosphohydrolase [Acidobacteriaceae bacterium]|nr:(deoxy)nucleoside triphosphate pyrophosphohydrolase [Acidobacteriaceae bacterium]
MEPDVEIASQPEREKSRARAVVAALILRGKEVLICQRKAGTAMGLQWEFPGGKIEPGESPEQALRRELEEELGIEASVGPYIAEVLHNYRNGGSIHLRFFAVHRFEGELQNRVFEDMRWAELRDLPAYNFLAADRKFIRDLAHGKIL